MDHSREFSINSRESSNERLLCSPPSTRPKPNSKPWLHLLQSEFLESAVLLQVKIRGLGNTNNLWLHDVKERKKELQAKEAELKRREHVIYSAIFI
ncbi:hypothetical protein K1719_011057 [Acacia pycnantha]|nr:hypothetical protein K1719_011057 [Acacia pycnantha]